MKQLKMLGLFAVSAAALMAFAGVSDSAVNLSGGLAFGFTFISATVICTVISMIGKTSRNNPNRLHTSKARNTITGTDTVTTETVDSQPIAELNDQLSNPSYERVTPNIIPVMAC